MQIFLDTNIIISIFRGNQDIISQFSSLAKEHDFCYSPIVEAELLQGSKSADIEKVNQFLDLCECVTIAKETGSVAGSLAAEYRKSHQGVTLDDFFIAASVKEHHLHLWTLNKKHFPMFDKEVFI